MIQALRFVSAPGKQLFGGIAQLLWPERFADDTVHLRQQIACECLRVSRDHGDELLGSQGFDEQRQFVASHVRHFIIQNYQVELVLLEARQRLLPSGCCLNRVTVEVEGTFDGFADQNFIVHYKDPMRSGFWWCHNGSDWQLMRV